MRILIALLAVDASRSSRIRPDVVLSIGGYVAFPGGMMAVLWGKPLVVHEPGAVAGITNRVLAPVADRVIVGMEGAFDRPVAQAWANHIPKPQARRSGSARRCARRSPPSPPPDERYAGRSGPLRLLVVGGSLGAQTMNDLVLAALASMPPRRASADRAPGGREALRALAARYREARRRGRGRRRSSTTWRARYAWCDVLVCRSGAITVAEIAAAGVAAILFPLPWFVVDEQTANAAFLADRDAGIALTQLETTPGQLAELLRGLDRDRLSPNRAQGARARQTRRDRGAAPTSAWSSRMRHKVKRIHFVGIGGSGMSGIAEVFAQPRLHRDGLRPLRERRGAAAARAGRQGRRSGTRRRTSPTPTRWWSPRR